MPSGYTTALPTKVALGVGVLFYNSTSVFGVSDGGLRVRVEKDMENLPFDNKGADVEGLDVVWAEKLVITGEFIEINDALFTADLVEPGLTATGTAGTPSTVTYTVPANRALFSTGDYIPNFVYQMTRADNTKVRYVAPKMWCAKYELISQSRAPHKISVEWHLRLAQATAATSTDTASYSIELVAAA